MALQYSTYDISEITQETQNIRTFRLKPAGGSTPPIFKAGQFFMLRLSDAPAELKPPFRSYSCLSPPGGNTLDFGIKLQGAFTTELFKRLKGDKIEVSGPYGHFALPEKIGAPIVFLAGGIGITPLLSMARQLAHLQHKQPFFLFYSNRNENEIAYRALIDELASSSHSFRLIFTLTGENVGQEWKGEKGRIDAQMLARHLGSAIPLNSCEFYLCGSPQFVSGLIEALKASGVPPEKIKKEQW